MSGITKKDRIKNKYVTGSLGEPSTVVKMKENRLRWFGRHVMKI